MCVYFYFNRSAQSTGPSPRLSPGVWWVRFWALGLSLPTGSGLGGLWVHGARASRVSFIVLVFPDMLLGFLAVLAFLLA